jgi:hypothetical protein
LLDELAEMSRRTPVATSCDRPLHGGVRAALYAPVFVFLAPVRSIIAPVVARALGLQTS